MIQHPERRETEYSMVQCVGNPLTVLRVTIVDLVSVGREAYADDESKCDPDCRDHEEGEFAGGIWSPAEDQGKEGVQCNRKRSAVGVSLNI